MSNGWPRTASASSRSGPSATTASRRRRRSDISFTSPVIRGRWPEGPDGESHKSKRLQLSDHVFFENHPAAFPLRPLPGAPPPYDGGGRKGEAVSAFGLRMTDGHYLEVRSLSKRFGDFTALGDISLDIAEGEFVCFLGPSGCGKTTLLRAIAGLDPQTSGTIRQKGRDVSRLPPAQRDFGIVFQSYALFPNLTVTDNVGYGLVSRRQARGAILKRVNELLTLVGMPDAGPKYPAQLSGGQQQRIALARALATSPGLLLLDEPLSALDARVRLRLRHEIKALQRTLGVTTILVTHDQEEALTMADRIVVMNHGAIEQVGSPQEIYRQPATAFVADFVGSMNFLAGKLAAPERIEVGALSFACAPQDGLAPGTDVRICIRPEDVRVRDLPADSVNRVAVEVAELDFVGAFCRATLRLRGTDGMSVVADFSSNLIRDLAVAPVSRLEVALPLDRVRVFAA